MRAPLTALLILLSLPLARAAEPDAALATLLRSLAQPAPASTAFVEQRESALLSEPLLLRGRLDQPDADTLVRRVESPYAERSTIRAERVEVEREGSPARRFALRRAPELGALLDSFRALLGGDAALLERHYAVELDGDIAAAWRLRLTPHATRRQVRIAGITLYGRAAALECFQLHQADGGSSRMLLGPAAESATPLEAAALQDRFAAHCALPDAAG